MDFSPIVELRDGIGIIKAREIDAYSAPMLQEAFSRIFETGTNSIVVDMSELEYIDLTAARVLISGWNNCNELGGKFILQDPEIHILKILSFACMGKETIVMDIAYTKKAKFVSLAQPEVEALCLAS